MKLDEKISQAKAKLLVEYPYFGTLASRVELVVDDNIEAFKSDGKVLRYKEGYLLDLKVDELEFILANAAMHKSLSYENRKNNRSGRLWQMATDISINSMLLENGMSMPNGAIYRKIFDGMYAEEIYAQLKDEILRDDEELEYEADDKDDVEKKFQDEILQEQLFAQEALGLLEQEVNIGEAPKSIERFFKLEYLSNIDWRDELRLALEKYFQDDYTLLPPSKKLLSYGIYLPSSISTRFRLVIAIDSSGSIDEELLNQFLSEVNFLMDLIQNYQIELIVCDDKVRSHKTFYSGEALELDLIGGGGTNFCPVFSYVDDNFDDVELLLYFSDLDGVFPDKEPSYEVKWISSSTKDIPFGNIVKLS